jgi:hypothetical protein
MAMAVIASTRKYPGTDTLVRANARWETYRVRRHADAVREVIRYNIGNISRDLFTHGKLLHTERSSPVVAAPDGNARDKLDRRALQRESAVL